MEKAVDVTCLHFGKAFDMCHISHSFLMDKCQIQTGWGWSVRWAGIISSGINMFY